VGVVVGRGGGRAAPGLAGAVARVVVAPGGGAGVGVGGGLQPVEGVIAVGGGLAQVVGDRGLPVERVVAVGRACGSSHFFVKVNRDRLPAVVVVEGGKAVLRL